MPHPCIHGGSGKRVESVAEVAVSNSHSPSADLLVKAAVAFRVAVAE